jgi:F-type H+-transporting ATPase subunit b
MMDTTFWVAVSFFLFIALILYLAVPRRIIAALDKRAADIKQELEEARRLREEAQSILADYQRKQRDAEKEGAEIVAMAEREARAYAEETRAAFEEMLKRRMAQADSKIARAESEAIAEVRNRAVDASIQAAELIIPEVLTKKKTAALLDDSLRALGKTS